MFLTIVEDPHFCELGAAGKAAFRASLPRPAAPPRCRDALGCSARGTPASALAPNTVCGPPRESQCAGISHSSSGSLRRC